MILTCFFQKLKDQEYKLSKELKDTIKQALSHVYISYVNTFHIYYIYM